ncbi:DUF5063 domain-containing protein [Kineococcus sp. SYSU DK002]|uniref:DUF5063 domain-containing protein n=1 Tax=Kineococcus sp. SYSU DK002 TaxID=3383123 RepID=UPI003D7D1ADE
MREAAQAYCFLIDEDAPGEEAGAENGKTAFALRLLTALSDAVAAAVRLPEVEPSDADLPTPITHEQWLACYQRIGKLTGLKPDYYWQASSPFAADQVQADISLGDLSDDLADIWRDLKTGLLALDAGTSLHDVQWQWRQDYWTH